MGCTATAGTGEGKWNKKKLLGPGGNRKTTCWDWEMTGVVQRCEQDLMKAATVPYQLYQQHQHSYGTGGEKSQSSGHCLKTSDVHLPRVQLFPQRPSLADPPQGHPFLLLCCPVLIVCMGMNRSSEACSCWTAIEQG